MSQFTTKLMGLTMNEWADFFRMLDDISNAEGTWQEKRDHLVSQAKEHDSETTLGEIVEGWFGGEMDYSGTLPVK